MVESQYLSSEFRKRRTLIGCGGVMVFESQQSISMSPGADVILVRGNRGLCRGPVSRVVA
jgi:hypothetical protein